MIISEVNAFANLLSKATSFYIEAKDGWYKGCAELAAFEEKVLTLDVKHSQWRKQLRSHGISEDRHFLLVVKLAEKAIDEQLKIMRELQKSGISRLKKRVFPGELSLFVQRLLEIVDAGPQLLENWVTNNELLNRYVAQTPNPLPFGQDENYVPIDSTVLEVQRALLGSARVVTVHGGSGTGTSCLVKHLAIHYVEEERLPTTATSQKPAVDVSAVPVSAHAVIRKSNKNRFWKKKVRVVQEEERLQTNVIPQTPAVFPDGVHYIYCGKGADKRIKQLQLELLQSLGLETGDNAAPIDSATSTGVATEYTPLPPYKKRLISGLAEQKLLIILDDLWEETVLPEVWVPAMGVKYLITSQRRDIYSPAKKIPISMPNDREARRIMANYTDGLPIRGQFPPNIQRVTDDIIRKLGRHPLCLARIGVSINGSRATHTSQWEVISANLYPYLDESDLHRRPAFDGAYSHSVSESILVMVNLLPEEEKRLLSLITLLGGRRLPEPLVKYFYKFIQKTRFAVKYINQEKFLEDRSLIESFTVGENTSLLDCHSLTWRYIRDKNTEDMRSVASQILIATGSQDAANPIEKGDTEEALVTVLGSIYYDPLCKDIIESNVEKLKKALNGAVIPRSLNTSTDTRDYVKSDTKPLVWLLNGDHEEGDWKSQAHECVKKSIIKFACQGKLDDDSMASLVKHPQTTSIACRALSQMSRCHREDYRDRDITFSSAYCETMETLLSLLDDERISIKRRAVVMRTLLEILNYESSDTILKVAAQYKAILAMDSEPEGQVLMIGVLCRISHGRGLNLFAGSPGVLEHLLGVFLFGKDRGMKLMQLSAAICIESLLRNISCLMFTVAAFPNALQMLFDLFVSQDMLVEDDYALQEAAGHILLYVSTVPELRIKLMDIPGLQEGFGKILVKLEEAWQETHDDDDRWNLGEKAVDAASILENLDPYPLYGTSQMGKRLQVAIPIFDKITMLDAIGPYEVLQKNPSVDVVFVSHKPGPISDRLGHLSIIATHSYQDVPNPDIVLVPGGIGVSKLLHDEVFISWLQKAHEKTLYTTSVCTGSLLLGSAGLLKGLKATTHWGAMAELTKYGATPSDKRVVQEGKIITSAGVSSGIDMALHLTTLIADEAMAKAIQLILEYDPEPPFDTGSLGKAGPEIEAKARSLLMEANRREANNS